MAGHERNSDGSSSAPKSEESPGSRLSIPFVGPVGWVFAGKLLAAGASFLTLAVAGRILGPALFGRLAILLVLMRVLAGLVGPALDTAMVRFASPCIDREPQRAAAYFGSAFVAKSVLGVVLVALGLALAHPLRDMLLDPSAGTSPPPILIPMVFLGAAIIMALDYVRAFYQAHERFTPYVLLEVLLSGTRLAAVVLLATGGMATVFSILSAYVVAPALVAIAGSLMLPIRALTGPSDLAGAARAQFRFARWVIAACAFTSLAQGLDMMLVGWLDLPEGSIGDYGAARTLMTVGDLAILSLFSVLLPKVSRMERREDIRAFIGKYSRPTLLAAVALSPLLLAAGLIARTAFGADFVDAGRLFAVLFLGTLFALASAPAGTAIYGMGRSHIIAVLEGTKLLVTLLAGYWAVCRFGVFGMAWTVAIVKGTIGLLTYGAAWWTVRSTCEECRGYETRLR